VGAIGIGVGGAGADDVQWAVLCFLVDVADIEREEAEGDEDDTHKEEEDRGKNRRAAEVKAPRHDIAVEEHKDAERSRKEGDQYAQVPGEAQGHERVGDEAFGGEFDELPEAVGGHAVLTFRRGKVYVVAFESEPVDEATCHAVMLGKFFELVDDDAVEEAEIGRARSNGCFAQTVHELVVDDGAKLLGSAVACVVVAYAHHDIGTRVPLHKKVGDKGGWVLEVGVYGECRVAQGLVEARRGRRFFTEVARKFDDADAPVFRGKRFEVCLGGVGAAVIHKHNLEAVLGKGGKGCAECVKKGRDRDLFIVDRYDNANALRYCRGLCRESW